MTKCPKCQSEMIHGKAAVHSSLLGTLVVGFFWQRLWFYPDDENHEVRKVLASGRASPAWECVKCGAVVIEPSSYD
jgi:hypothetical protein